MLNLRTKCLRLVESLGLGSSDEVVSVEPLSGGVSCDIAAVDLGSRKICAKFALPKLRVAADWYAPVVRNRTEYAWLEFAQQVVPGSAPKLLGHDTGLNGFAMEFIPNTDAYLWKAALLERAPTRNEAREVGDTLGRIHAASSRQGFDASRFRNLSDFSALRLEPYLEFTASRHPDLSQPIHSLVEDLKSKSTSLIHGDVSPKNILFRGEHCLILDAECATMGDACFDLAFCMNHLALKCFHMPDRSAALLDEVIDLSAAYAGHVDWEAEDGLEARVCRLLPALMLARIDGKSPVEYLDEFTRKRVRISSIKLLRRPPSRLADIVEHIGQACGV